MCFTWDAPTKPSLLPAFWQNVLICCLLLLLTGLNTFSSYGTISSTAIIFFVPSTISSLKVVCTPWESEPGSKLLRYYPAFCLVQNSTLVSTSHFVWCLALLNLHSVLAAHSFSNISPNFLRTCVCLHVHIHCVNVFRHNKKAWTLDPRFRDAGQDMKKMTSLESCW